jgi:hypothetical protein
MDGLRGRCALKRAALSFTRRSSCHQADKSASSCCSVTFSIDTARWSGHRMCLFMPPYGEARGIKNKHIKVAATCQIFFGRRPQAEVSRPYHWRRCLHQFMMLIAYQWAYSSSLSFRLSMDEMDRPNAVIMKPGAIYTISCVSRLNFCSDVCFALRDDSATSFVIFYVIFCMNEGVDGFSSSLLDRFKLRKLQISNNFTSNLQINRINVCRKLLI